MWTIGMSRDGIFPVLGRGRARAAADEDHEVRLLHDLARRNDAAVRADHARAERMRLAQAALPAHGRAHRRIEQRCDGFERIHRAGGDHAAAADENGPARCEYRFRRRLHRLRIRAAAPCRIALVTVLRPQIRRIDGLLHHIERQADVRAARSSGRHLAECAADRLWNLFRAIAHRVPFRNGPIQRFLIELRERVAAAREHGHIRRDAEDGDAGLVRFDEARQEIRRASAARTFAYARPAAHARITVRHVGRTALVAREHVRDAVLHAVKRIVERQTRVAAEAEDVAHAVELEHADGGFRTVELVHQALPAGTTSASSASTPRSKTRSGFTSICAMLPRASAASHESRTMQSTSASMSLGG